MLKSGSIVAVLIAFMVGMIAGIAVGLAGRPAAVEKAPVADAPPKEYPFVLVSAATAPKDDTTREAVALKLLHDGTLRDWGKASPETRLLMTVIYVGRYTPAGDNVALMARVHTIANTLDDMWKIESSGDGGRIADSLALWLTLHCSMNKLEPRK